MSVWSRLVRLIRMRFKKREDPLTVIQHDLALMEERVQQVKSNGLSLGKSKIQLEHRIGDLGRHVERYQQEARRALRLGREDLAKLALANKQSTLVTQRLLQGKVAALEQKVAELERLKEELVSQIMIFKIKRDELMLTRSAVQAELFAEELRLGWDQESGFARSQGAMNQLHQEVQQLQAQVDATRELSQPRLPPLDEEPAPQAPVSPEVAADLEQLKRELEQNPRS